MNVVYFQQIYVAGKLLAGKRDERVIHCDEIQIMVVVGRWWLVVGPFLMGSQTSGAMGILNLKTNFV